MRGGRLRHYNIFNLARCHLILLCLSCYPVTAQGNFKALLKEFLQSHLQLKINQLESSKATIRKDLLKAAQTWQLSGSSRYSDNQLDTIPGINLSDFTVTHYSLGVSREFDWGLRLNLDNAFSHRESASLAAPSLGNPATELSIFEQTLTLSQDLGRNFLGRQFYTTLEGANESIRLSKITLSQQNQQALGTFYQKYLTARLRQTVLDLQRQALQRSHRRLEVTRKRVDDGLNEKANLYAAQLEYIREQEESASAQLALEEALSNLSQSLH